MVGFWSIIAGIRPVVAVPVGVILPEADFPSINLIINVNGGFNMTDFPIPNLSNDLSGRVALVTGTTSGLDKRFAIVRGLRRQGRGCSHV